MLQFRELEHFDDFGTEAVYWVDVSGVPEKLIQEAKNIDSDNYSEDCFGVCFYNDKGTEKFTAVMEAPEKHLYYIDNLGDKHWLSYKLDEQETGLIIENIKLVMASQKAD